MYPKRIYVGMNVDYEPDGKMMPAVLKWCDGTVYEIDRVLDVRRAASSAGGMGTRYTVRIMGQERHLFFEDIYSDTGKSRWFVESG